MGWPKENTFPMPTRRVTVAASRTFTAKEMDKICQGLVPEQMEDKWFIYWCDGQLFFHRSWTGYCIYVARFESAQEGAQMTEFVVNRDPDQYEETSDLQDAKMIQYLIDLLLLRKQSAYPGKEQTPEMNAIEKWSQVGRASLEKYPTDGSEPN